ncbi:MAG TPA: hypothetical protein VI248_08125 [Kineosporiaceae bacterium]
MIGQELAPGGGPVTAPVAGPGAPGRAAKPGAARAEPLPTMAGRASWCGLPAGRLRFALYPRALLRTTGFDVRPLLRLLEPGPEPAPDRSLAAVRDAFSDPRLREAVAQCNPLFHEIALAPGRALTTDTAYLELTHRGRRQVGTAHRYVRRLLGRTGTKAFFGPTLVVGWDPDGEAPVTLGEPGTERCLIGLSHWLVQELSERQRRELPPSARAWRLDPLWRREGMALYRELDRRALALTSTAARVWQALRVPATPAELLDVTGLPPADVVAALALLSPALRPHPQPPSTLVDGLAWLRRQWPPGSPGEGPTQALVARLAALVAQAEQTPWPRVHTLRARIRAEVEAAELGSGRDPAGRHGRHGERDVVHENRSSPWNGRVSFGRPAVESARAALAAVLPMMMLDALLRQADAREAVVRAIGGRPTGLVELAARRIDPVSTRTSRWHARIGGLVRPDPDLDVVEVAPADLEVIAEGLWPLVDVRDDDQLGALPAVDLMLTGGPPGVGRWVLSECHDDSSGTIGGVTSRAQPGGGADFERFCAALGRWLDTSRLASVLGRRFSRHVTPELPGLTIELSGTSGKPRGQVAAAAEVLVSPDGAALEHAGRRYQLYPGDVSGPLFLALSLPCLRPVPFATGRRYTPRVVVDGVVVQRRRWRVDLPGAQDHGSGPVTVTDWAEEHGLPPRFFLRHPDEPKPLLVDIREPFCRVELTRLRPDRVVCTEVLPDLDDTWWDAGGRQAAELRIPVLVRWDRGDTGGPAGVTRDGRGNG